MISIKRFSLTICASLVISACGGGSESEPVPTAAPEASSGLYVGYYQEDPASNPEDPTIGAFSLNLPSNDSDFQGSMYFTYVGCQSSNVGRVAGKKSGKNLSGNWSGVIDASQQSGSYTGIYNADTSSYAGTYNNNGGKQFLDLSPCIQYWIAPNGSWEMFAIDSNTPSTFNASVSLPNISWPSVAGAVNTLVYVLDPVIAQTAGNPVLWQTIEPSTTYAAIPSEVALQLGKEYIAVVAVTDAQSKRIAFSSKRFTP